MTLRAAYWKRRAEEAERRLVLAENRNTVLVTVMGQYRTERDEATARLRDVVADRVNRSAS